MTNFIDQLTPVPAAPESPKGHRWTKGKRMGLPMNQFLSNLFAANVLAPVKKKLSDKDILDQLYAEYPESKVVQAILTHDPKQRTTINSLRSRYHRGTLPNEVPLAYSFQYNAKGQPVDDHQRILSAEQIIKAETEQKKRYNGKRPKGH